MFVACVGKAGRDVRSAVKPKKHVPARDDTSAEVVVSVRLFKVHFVVTLCLCVVRFVLDS